MRGGESGVCASVAISMCENSTHMPQGYGVMRARCSEGLLLWGTAPPPRCSGMRGGLYREFDTYNITDTLTTQLVRWAERDLGMRAVK